MSIPFRTSLGNMEIQGMFKTQLLTQIKSSDADPLAQNSAARNQMTPQLSRLVPTAGLEQRGACRQDQEACLLHLLRELELKAGFYRRSSCEIIISSASYCLQNYSFTSVKWNWGTRLVFFPLNYYVHNLV